MANKTKNNKPAIGLFLVRFFILLFLLVPVTSHAQYTYTDLLFKPAAQELKNIFTPYIDTILTPAKQEVKVFLTASSLNALSANTFNSASKEFASIFTNYNDQILEPAGKEVKELVQDYKNNVARLIAVTNPNIQTASVVNTVTAPITTPAKATPPPQGGEKTEARPPSKKLAQVSTPKSSPIIIKQNNTTISETQLLSALNKLLQNPQIISQLKGKDGQKGDQGTQGISGQQIPGPTTYVQAPSPYNFGSTIPPAPQNNTIGFLGGFAALGAQDLTTTILHTTGTATLANLVVTGGSTLSGNLTVSGTITSSSTFNPSLTLGSVFFQGASGLTEDNANLFWDDTNNRLGLGDTTPSAQLEVGNGTDSLQVSSVGDILFVDADGVASITGPAGGALGLVAGAAQALTLTGNLASTWSTSNGLLTITGDDGVTINATSTAGITGNVPDNLANALDIQEGSNNYINISTADAGANISLGNATTNPTFGFLGTGLITVAGAGAEINSLTLTTGNVTLTDGDLSLSSGEISATSDDTTGTAFSFTGVSTTGTTLGIIANSLTSGTAFDISSTSTAAASNTQKLLNIALSGTNGTTTQTTYGAYISNTHAGTLSTNVGLYATASGATNNYAAIFEAGNVGIGDTSPASLFTVGSGDLFQVSSGGVVTNSAGLTATTGNVAITAGLLSLNGVTRIDNTGVGTFITGTVIGSQTFTTNNIADSGALTIASGTATALTLNSGTTGDINIGTDASAETINIGNTGLTGKIINIGNNATAGTVTTIGSATNTDLALLDPNWSVTGAGAGTFTSISSGSGAISGGAGSFTTLTSSGASTIATGASLTNTFGTGTGAINTFGEATGTNAINGATTILGTTLINSTGTSATTIGNSTGTLALAGTTFALTSGSGLNITSAGALSGITTIATSSTINSQTISSTASFTGTVQAATSFLAPTFDTATGVAMNIGTATQTALTLGRVGSTTAINGSTITAGSATTTAISLGNVTTNPTLTLLGTGLTTLGGSLTVTGTAWTATPTISGLVTATLGLTSNGLVTGTLGATITGATVSLNTSSNFPVNIATGTSTGAVSIGGNLNTVAIDSSDWNIDTTGAITNATYDGLTITANGTNTLNIQAGKTLATNGSITLTGTDAQTYTFPTTTATLARTDAGNTFTGASTASAWVLTSPTITTKISPTTDDGAPLGDTTHNFSDLFLASGAVINYANSDVVLTHSTGILTLGTGTLKITNPTNTATSVVTIDGTQTLSNKTLTAPALGSATATGLSITSANTTEVTTASALALNVNSLTTGTGFYAASSTLSSGSLFDLAITGTAGLTNQKGINVSLSGANGTGAQTTYGAYLSNTHTGTSTNVGLYATATGGTNNYAAIFEAGNVGIGTTNPGSILALGGTAARIFGMDRNTTAATAGQGFTISSGGAIAGTADLAGGDLTLKSGTSTGTGSSAIHFYTASAGLTGTSDNAPTEKVTILESGNVGIGTTNPTNILSLGNSAARKFWIENTATDVVGRALTVAAGGTVAGTSVSDVVGGNLILQSGLGTGTGDSSISFQTGTTLTTGTTLQTMSTKMTILGNGNVGIGTTAPTYTLDVTRANHQVARFVSTGTNVNADVLIVDQDNSNSRAALQIQGNAGATEVLFASSGGNVGIGTASPGNMLTVSRNTAGYTTPMLKVEQLDDTSWAIAQIDRQNAYRASATEYSTAGTANWYTGTLYNGGSLNSFYSIGTTSSLSGAKLVIDNTNGNVGIGTTNPTNILSLGNSAARKFWIENTATDVVGRALTVAAGGTVAGTSVSDVVGGNLILQSGLGTGTGDSSISFQTGTTLTTGTTLQTMSTKMTILGNGNVGIGTTNPGAKLDIGLAGTTLGTLRLEGNTSGYVQLQSAAAAGSWTMTLPDVDGDAGQQLQTDGAGITTWAAAGSLRSMKDISGEVTDANVALEQILGTKIYRFHYKPKMGTGDSTTEYVGVMADEAPWAMHWNGTIVNPVNTLGYMVLGLQATNKRIDELDLKINDLQSSDISVNTENPLNTLGQYANSFFDDVVKKVENGVVFMRGLVVDTLKIGSPEKRTGVTLYDEVTGEPYCLSIASGATKTIAGECVVISPQPITAPPQPLPEGEGSAPFPLEKAGEEAAEETPLEIIEVLPGEEIPATDVLVEEIIEPIQTSETAPVIEEVVPVENISEEITP